MLQDKKIVGLVFHAEEGIALFDKREMITSTTLSIS